MLIVRNKLIDLLKKMVSEGKITLETELVIREEMLKNYTNLQPEREDK